MRIRKKLHCGSSALLCQCTSLFVVYHVETIINDELKRNVSGIGLIGHMPTITANSRRAEEAHNKSEFRQKSHRP
jgi:hypothetical protein